VATTDDVVWNNNANSSADNGHNLRSDGRAGFAYYNATANANATVNINRTGSDGDLIRLFKSGSSVGSIGAEGGDLVLGTGATAGIQFNDATPTIRPWNMSANSRTDGVCDLGYSNSKFKDLYLSGDITSSRFSTDGDGIKMGSGLGIKFDSYASGNVLNDYEEGTFSVTVDNLDGFAGTPSSATFTYTKIGNKVFCEGVFFMTGSSGNVAVDDSIQFTSASLPFTPSKLGTCLGAASVQTGAATGDNCAMGYVALADSGVYGIQIHNVNGTVTRNNAKISFKITYETTA
jgi:hypothetical protein